MFSRSLDKDTIEEFYRRYMSTQRIPFNLERSIDHDLFNFVSKYADCIGCAKELIFFPLITAVAGCMGNNAAVQMNSEWTEEIVLWYVISARRGEKKSLALNRVKNAVKGLEKEIQAVIKVRHSDSDETHAAGCFVFDENNLSLFKGVTLLKDVSVPSNLVVMLDNFGSVLNNIKSYNFFQDSQMLLQLYEGSNDRDEFEHDKCKLARSRVNFVAMTQSIDIVALLNTGEPDGFLDRVLFACPKEESRLGFSSDFNPSQNPPSLQTILSKVRNIHQVQKMTYSFSSEGLAEFLRFTEKFQQMRDLVQGEERRGAINKAPGQMARLSAVLTALGNGLAMATDSMPSKCLSASVIDVSVVKCAFLLTKYSVDLKLALLPQYEANVPEVLYEKADIVPDLHQQQLRNYRKRSAYRVQNLDISAKQHKRMQAHQTFDTYKSTPQTIRGFSNQSHEIDGGPEERQHSFTHSDVVINRSHPIFTPELHFTSSVAQIEQNSSNSGAEMQQNMVYMDTDPVCRDQVLSDIKQEESGTPPSSEHIYIDKGSIKNINSSAQYIRSVGRQKNAADIYEFSDEEFVEHCCDKMRKLMLTKGAVITAAFACQYKLFPPVPVCLRMASPNTRHPAWAASKFFERMQHFGLGTVSKTRGSSLRFMKNRLEDMLHQARNMLARIGVSDEEYEMSYPKHMGLTLPVTDPISQILTDPNFSSHTTFNGTAYKMVGNDLTPHFEGSE